MVAYVLNLQDSLTSKMPINHLLVDPYSLLNSQLSVEPNRNPNPEAFKRGMLEIGSPETATSVSHLLLFKDFVFLAYQHFTFSIPRHTRM